MQVSCILGRSLTCSTFTCKLAMAMATEACAQGSQSRKIMNPELWGNLQQHMGLEKVQVRLPLTEFFRNRLVCKEWNRLAADREFLEESFRYRPLAIPEPYFLLRCYGVWGRCKLLLLARDHHLSGRLWSTTTLPSHIRCNASAAIVSRARPFPN